MRTKIAFTEQAIDELALVGDETDVWVWDAQRSGLGVRLRKLAGGTSITYYVQYQYGGRDHRDPIGSTSEFTLQAAQAHAYVVRHDAANGKNPKVAKAERSQVGETFAQVACKFVAERAAEGIRENTLRGYRRYLIESDETYFQKLFKLELRTISKRQIAECLDAITERSPSAASDARGALILLYKFAQLKDYVDEGHNPALYTKDPHPKSDMKETGRAHILSDLTGEEPDNYDELIAIWKAAELVRDNRNDTDYGRIIRLAYLLGNRREEIGSMEWSEIKGNVWHLPAERTKTGFARIIILSPMAMAIIGEPEEGRKFVFGAEDSGFSNWSKCSRKFQERPELLGKLNGDFKMHDLRRTMRTGLDKIGIARDLAEAAVGHVEKKLERTYNKHEKIKERAAATQQWADHLQGLLHPAPQLRLVG